MAFKRPSVQFCPAPPDSLKTPDHHTDGRGFSMFAKLFDNVFIRGRQGNAAADKFKNGEISA